MGVLPPIVFWPAAAVLAGLCAVLVLWFSARAAKGAAAAGEDPARAVYRRQIADIDELVDRGLLPAGEREAAHAEAARRLLNQTGDGEERAGARLAPLVAAAVAALAALGLYVWLGSPGQPDQPYKARLQQWRSTPPTHLRLDEFAAVGREAFKKQPPSDPALWESLAKAEFAAGDAVAAGQDLNHAIALNPNNATLYAELGSVLTAAAGNKPTPDAEAALDHALRIDPKNQAALYYLGGARAADGDKAGAARLWRRLAGDLPQGDVRRQPLIVMADQIEKGGAAAPPPPAAQAAATGDQAGFIRGMVASLQARLDADPNDPAGWARLVRSYGVLGDIAAQHAALAEARRLFAKRPDALRPIEAEAATRPRG